MIKYIIYWATLIIINSIFMGVNICTCKITEQSRDKIKVVAIMILQTLLIITSIVMIVLYSLKILG